MEEAVARAVESAHVPTLANAYYLKAMFETVCGNAEAARSVAETVVKLSQDHGVALYIALGTLSSSWARARLTTVSPERQSLGWRSRHTPSKETNCLYHSIKVCSPSSMLKCKAQK